MKKNIALNLLKEIQPKIDKHRQLINPVVKTDALFHLIDNDPKSDFYFKIYPSKEATKYISEFKPRHSQTTEKYRSEQTIEAISKQFDAWINILDEYNKIHSIYDDPITEAYQKEFETQFELVDQDAEYASFDLDKQLFIDSYLDNAILKLESAVTEGNKGEIEDLIAEANSLKAEQTQLTKKQVIKRLSKIWAKARKYGLNLLKEIYVEARKELIKHLIKGMLES